MEEKLTGRKAGAEHCIIVGAGAAGLMAARELAPFCRVTVLEARHLPGGRIRTLPGKDIGTPVEAGAEFVHGKLPLTLGLLKEAGLEYAAVEGNMYRVVRGKWEKQDEMMEGWEELLRQMQQLPEDTTLSDFLERYYGQKEHALFRKNIIRYAQGFDLADAAKASVKGLCQEWISETEENFRIRKGYGALTDFLVKECVKEGCSIQMDQQVRHIVWEEGKVIVHTDTASFTGGKVIVTVPLGILQHERADAFITFSPAIGSYLGAARSIGYGAVIKIIFGFSRAFWNDHKQVAGFIISDEPIGTWWTSGPGEVPLLTGWLGGPPADEWSNAGEEALLERGLSSLSGLFNLDVSVLRSLCTGRYIANWRKDTLAMGAYSYPTPASFEAKKLLNTPLRNTLYFAGEALYEGKSPGTVEAALESGKGVALNIKRLL